jgi:hypothetical protein
MNRGGTAIWESDGVGPGGAQNRAFSLTNSAQTLPVVYFNNQSTPPGVTAVTFQVNLAVQQSITNFDPAMHSVEARGSFNGWSSGITLSPSTTNSLIYQGTTNVAGSPGAQFEYKFVINKAGTLLWEGNVGTGGPSGNRLLTLVAGNQLLPVAYFNNLTNNPGTGIPVTFRVSAAVPFARGTFNPNSIAMVVAGPFNNWSTTASRLTNSASNPNLFVGTVNMATVSPGASVPFKFVANGSTWETGDDRSFTLGDSAQTLPIEYFDRTNNLGPLTVSLNAPFEDAAIVTLSWTGGLHVRLQTANELSASSWRDVAGTEGQNTYTVDLTFEIDPRPAFFRLVGP